MRVEPGLRKNLLLANDSDTGCGRELGPARAGTSSEGSHSRGQGDIGSGPVTEVQQQSRWY